MRFANIGEMSGTTVDLVVKVVDGTTYSSTKAFKRNGKANGFGIINIEELRKGRGGSNGEGSFEFCLYDHENPDQKVTAESFRFAMYDLDGRSFANNGLKEKITIDTTQIEDYILSKESEIVVSCDNGSPKGSPIDSFRATGVDTVFHSTTKGNGSDNPTDLDNLDELQKNRSIMFSFKEKSCFTMTLSHYCPVDKCSWYGGGNIYFSGGADHLIEEGDCMYSGCTIPTEDLVRVVG